jgi:hypothetical protein
MQLKPYTFAGLALNGLFLVLIAVGTAVAEEHPPPPFDTAGSGGDWRRFYASAGIGFGFYRGDYGDKTNGKPDKKTNSWSVPVYAKFEYVPVTFRVSVPYQVIDGAEGLREGDVDPTAGAGSSTRHGIGDTTVSLMYSWYPKRKFLPSIDLKTKVKIPTASSKDIGTGHADVTFQFEMTKKIGQLGLFSSASYRLKGGFYNDIWLASTGAMLKLKREIWLGVAYDFRESSTSTAGDSHEIGLFASLRLGAQRRIGPFAVFGLSENSPDWGLGATFSYDF